MASRKSETAKKIDFRKFKKLSTTAFAKVEQHADTITERLMNGTSQGATLSMRLLLEMAEAGVDIQLEDKGVTWSLAEVLAREPQVPAEMADAEAVAEEEAEEEAERRAEAEAQARASGHAPARADGSPVQITAIVQGPAAGKAHAEDKALAKNEAVAQDKTRAQDKTLAQDKALAQDKTLAKDKALAKDKSSPEAEAESSSPAKQTAVAAAAPADSP